MAAISHSLPLALICGLIFSHMIAIAAASRAVPGLALDAVSPIDFSYKLKVVPNKEDESSSPPPPIANKAPHWKRDTPPQPPVSPPELPPTTATATATTTVAMRFKSMPTLRMTQLVQR